MTIKQSTIDRLLAEQRGKCANCWRPVPPMEVHHACYTRDRQFGKWLDMPENLVLLCRKCHQDNHGYLTRWFKRLCFWSDKIDASYDMEAWHDSIPMREKDRFVYLDSKNDA